MMFPVMLFIATFTCMRSLLLCDFKIANHMQYFPVILLHVLLIVCKFPLSYFYIANYMNYTAVWFAILLLQ